MEQRRTHTRRAKSAGERRAADAIRLDMAETVQFTQEVFARAAPLLARIEKPLSRNKGFTVLARTVREVSAANETLFTAMDEGLPIEQIFARLADGFSRIHDLLETLPREGRVAPPLVIARISDTAVAAPPILLNSLSGGGFPVPTSEVVKLLMELLALLEAILAADGARMDPVDRKLLEATLRLLREAIDQVKLSGRLIRLGRLEAIINQAFANLWRLGNELEGAAEFFPKLGRRVLEAAGKLATRLGSPLRLWCMRLLSMLARFIPHVLALALGGLIGYYLRKVRIDGVSLGEALDDLFALWFWAPNGSCESLYRQFTRARGQKLDARAQKMRLLERAFARQEIRSLLVYVNSECPPTAVKTALRRLLAQLQQEYRDNYAEGG